MQFIALIILVATVYVGFSSRVKTGIIELHLLWIAATGSAVYLFNGIAPALSVSMVCSVIAAFIWLTKEMYRVCGDD